VHYRGYICSQKINSEIKRAYRRLSPGKRDVPDTDVGKQGDRNLINPSLNKGMKRKEIMLVNLSIRIKQYKKGYAVEVKQKRLFGHRWVNVVAYNGSEEPFYYHTYQGAMDDLLKMIKRSLTPPPNGE